MARFKQACTREVTDKVIVVKEKKSKCIFSNPNQRLLTKVTVDGCQIMEGVKCDYLVLDHCSNEYFIELKGKDLPHAVEQLEASIQQLSNKNSNIRKKAIIVSSRNPSNDTSVQKAKLDFKKKYNTELVTKNMQLEIAIE